MKVIFASIVMIAVALGVWFFVISSFFIPKNYAECLKTPTNDYTRNELSCSFSPNTPAQQRLCEEKGGVINQFKQCLIIYHNPAFIFPKNLDECIQKIGSTDNQVCDIEVNKRGAYDQTLVQKLFDDCLKNGGEDRSQYINTAGCYIRFSKPQNDQDQQKTNAALNLLQQIPEIRTIENAVIKKGRKPFYTPEGQNGDIITVSLRESFPNDPHTSRIDTFKVNVVSKVITVEDVVTNKDITLNEWKKTVKERFP